MQGNLAHHGNFLSLTSKFFCISLLEPLMIHNKDDQYLSIGILTSPVVQSLEKMVVSLFHSLFIEEIASLPNL